MNARILRTSRRQNPARQWVGQASVHIPEAAEVVSKQLRNQRRNRPMVRAERRDQLLKIARELVAKEGIGALTMMALSERAKVAKPVVYSHFPNREAVAVALLDEHFARHKRLVLQSIADATTFGEYFSRLVDAAFEFEAASETPVRQITNGFSAGDAVNQAFLRHEENFRKEWEQLLRVLGVRPEVVEVAAYALWGMMDNTVYTFAITRQLKVAQETLKALLLAAVGAVVPDFGRKLKRTPLVRSPDGSIRAERPVRSQSRSPASEGKRGRPRRAAVGAHSR
jgi:AcrR family transcriptional regulator